METDSVEERITKIARKAAVENDVEFVHLEMAGTKRNQVVRIFADKDGGITIEDCSRVSRSIESMLDADDFIPGSYVLEVSSPGLDRELYALDDFIKFVGKLAKVKMVPDFQGPKTLNGRIVGVVDDDIVFDDRTGGELRFPYSKVQKANLRVDLEEELNRARSSKG